VRDASLKWRCDRRRVSRERERERERGKNRDSLRCSSVIVLTRPCSESAPCRGGPAHRRPLPPPPPRASGRLPLSPPPPVPHRPVPPAFPVSLSRDCSGHQLSTCNETERERESLVRARVDDKRLDGGSRGRG